MTRLENIDKHHSNEDQPFLTPRMRWPLIVAGALLVIVVGGSVLFFSFLPNA